MHGPRVILIDHHDSFTWNLVELLRDLGAQTQVLTPDRACEFCLNGATPPCDALVLSPGPGHVTDRIHRPTLDLLSTLKDRAPRLPILGVCLGHQLLALSEGGHLSRLVSPRHGAQATTRITVPCPLFTSPATRHDFTVGLYHSWYVENPLPDSLQVVAEDTDGRMMALRHRSLPRFGVQFHPESILTPTGPEILGAFLHLAANDPAVRG